MDNDIKNNLVLTMKEYNNSGCKHLLFESSDEYGGCNNTDLYTCCVSAINYLYKIGNSTINITINSTININDTKCININNSYYKFNCMDNGQNGQNDPNDTIFIIVMYSICFCFCIIPIIICLIDKIKYKIYNNKLQKYYRYNDNNVISINNPSYSPIYNPSYNPSY